MRHVGDSLRTTDCSASVVCGRPFLVDFIERRAPLEERSDWLTNLGLVSDGFGREERAALAEHWAEAGLREHASIAAFARFELQLLSLGAPDEMLAAARSAIADEARHARLCFSLASQYAGFDLGPGFLNLTGALDDMSVETILRTAVLEGCIGETEAALEAARACDLCDDRVVSAVLATIEADEARHAELAWRFVAWLLTEYPEMRPLCEETLREAAPIFDEDGVSSGEFLAAGVLDHVERGRVRRGAWTNVIEPCAISLLGNSFAPRSKAPRALRMLLAQSSNQLG